MNYMYLLKLRNHCANALLLAICVLSGCKVDDRYDLNNLDTESTVLKGMEFPIGDLRRITLDQLFDLKENQYFSTDAHGDYRIHVPFETFSFNVGLPLDKDLLPDSGKGFEFGELPAFLDDENLKVEFSGMEISLGIDSQLPVAATVSTGVDLLKSGSVTHHYAVNSLNIVPGKNTFVFNETGKGDVQNVDYQALPDIEKLFSPVPDKLIIHDFQVNIPESGQTGSFPVSCTITADSPIAFSALSACTITIPVDNAELNLDQIGLKKAVISMDAYNSVPLSFSLKATALDGNGGRLEGISAQTDVPIAAGTVDSPAHTPLKVTLMAEDLRFKGVILELHAASNQSVAGVRLNRNQGLELKNLVISLPDGIIVKNNNQ